MALQAFMLNQSPSAPRGPTPGHAEALSCSTGHLFKFLPFWFSPCFWGSLMWGPFPPHVGTLPSSQNPSSGSGSPYPDPRTQGTMAGCQGESLNLWCVCVLVAQSCPTFCDPMDHSPRVIPSMEFSRQEYWSGLLFPSPWYVYVNT